jgi:hypothetical protein
MIHLPGKKLLIIFMIIIAFPVSWYLLWAFQPKKPVGIILLNKSVSSYDGKDHNAAFWILKNNGFVKRDGKNYDPGADYYGFFPIKSQISKEYEIKEIRPEDIDYLSDHNDIAWFIDTYGVSFGDWHGNKSGDNQHGMLYGGLEHNDYLLISEMLVKDKLVIAEFNLFASPSSDLLREMTEKMVGIYWSGWTGMYFDNLDVKLNDDIPSWVVDSYKIHNNGQWPYSKSGIILINHDSRVIVLENETQIDIEVPLITTGKRKAERFGVPVAVHFPYRFDISYAADTTNVISWFELSVNSMGKELLASNNIPSRFPAVTGNGNFYYLSGNYSNYEISMFTSMFKTNRSFDFLFYNDKVESRSEFFRKYYIPLITTVISDHYEKNSLNDIVLK